MSRGAVASLSVLLGLISWLITLGLGRGPTPLQAGGRYLAILAIALPGSASEEKKDAEERDKVLSTATQ